MSTPVPPWLGWCEFVANPATGGTPPPVSAILLETSGYILTETGGHILLE